MRHVGIFHRKQRPNRPRNPRREAVLAFVGRNLVLFLVIYAAVSLASS